MVLGILQVEDILKLMYMYRVQQNYFKILTVNLGKKQIKI